MRLASRIAMPATTAGLLAFLSLVLSSCSKEGPTAPTFTYPATYTPVTAEGEAYELGPVRVFVFDGSSPREITDLDPAIARDSALLAAHGEDGLVEPGAAFRLLSDTSAQVLENGSTPVATLRATRSGSLYEFIVPPFDVPAWATRRDDRLVFHGITMLLVNEQNGSRTETLTSMPFRPGTDAITGAGSPGDTVAIREYGIVLREVEE